MDRTILPEDLAGEDAGAAVDAADRDKAPGSHKARVMVDSSTRLSNMDVQVAQDARVSTSSVVRASRT